MFDDSLIESRGQLATGARRWITAGSFGVQCVVALGVVALPLLHPEALSFRTMAAAVVVPPVRKPHVVVVERRAAAASRSPSFAVPVERMELRAAVLPSLHPVDEAVIADPTATHLASMPAAGGGISDLLGSAGAGGGRRVTADPALKQTPTISSGVSAGMLLGTIRPVYPRIAVAAQVQGVVVVEATISKTGAIESAHVLSGPAMLVGAALDAVRAARYRPYLLNGEATEVRTTVTVNFRLGGG